MDFNIDMLIKKIIGMIKHPMKILTATNFHQSFLVALSNFFFFWLPKSKFALSKTSRWCLIYELRNSPLVKSEFINFTDFIPVFMRLYHERVRVHTVHEKNDKNSTDHYNSMVNQFGPCKNKIKMFKHIVMTHIESFRARIFLLQKKCFQKWRKFRYFFYVRMY